MDYGSWSTRTWLPATATLTGDEIGHASGEVAVQWYQSVLVILAMAWAAYFVLTWLAGLAARPRPVRPDPPTPDLPGDPPPAVVGYLVNGCRVDPDAAVGTLMDLAARRYLELYQPANDPEQTLVRIREAAPQGLTAYEQRVMDRVVEAAGAAGSVPLTELTDGYPKEGYRWSERFRTEVIADAKQRGLTKERPIGVTGIALMVGIILACATGTALPAAVIGGRLEPGEQLGTGRTAVMITAIVLLTIALVVAAIVPVFRWLDDEHRSKAGRAVTARWLGVSAWLRAHESFTELPPSAVAVWDRYLSYGAALGVTPVVSRVAELVEGARQALWSNYTGTWRQVRVRYPGKGRRSGYPPLTIVVNGLVSLAFLYVLARFAREWFANEPLVVRYAVGAALVVLAARWVYRVLRAMADRLAPTVIEGEVLTKSNPPYLLDVGQLTGPMSGFVRKRMTTARQPYFAVVDDGRSDETIVWTVYPAWRNAGQCEKGDIVRLKGYRWCRYARKVTVVREAAARRAEAAPAS